MTKVNGQEKTETQYPESLRAEYERLAGWALNERETVTPEWVAEQAARYTRPPDPPAPSRMSSYWRKRWRELEEDGYGRTTPALPGVRLPDDPEPAVQDRPVQAVQEAGHLRQPAAVPVSRGDQARPRSA
ncbi:hypothetical protein D3C78_1484470 [compost metagenome]